MGRQRDQHVSQNIGGHDIISLCADLFLHLLIVDQVAEDDLELGRIDAVCAQVVLDGGRCAGIQIRSDRALDAEHEGQNGQNSAAGADVQHDCVRRQVLSDLADAELCGLMHAGAESCAGIDVEDQRGLLICDLRLLPGGNGQNIVDPELMEVLLPVVDPVQVLGFFNGDGPLADIGVGAQHGQFLQNVGFHLIGRPGLVVYEHMSVLCLFQKEAQDG